MNSFHVVLSQLERDISTDDISQYHDRAANEATSALLNGCMGIFKRINIWLSALQAMFKKGSLARMQGYLLPCKAEMY